MGWGFIAIDISTGEILKEHSEGRPVDPRNTNNKAELAAMIRSLQWLQGRPAKIFSDSQYVVNGVNIYSVKWAANGFVKRVNGSLSEVPNKALWIAVLRNRRPCQEVLWVRGHNGHTHNERADKLALMGRKSVSQP